MAQRLSSVPLAAARFSISLGQLIRSTSPSEMACSQSTTCKGWECDKCCSWWPGMSCCVAAITSDQLHINCGNMFVEVITSHFWKHLHGNLKSQCIYSLYFSFYYISRPIMSFSCFSLHIVELGRCCLSLIPLSKPLHPRKTRNAAATTRSILLAAFVYLKDLSEAFYTV
jgi:hypothetical protein